MGLDSNTIDANLAVGRHLQNTVIFKIWSQKHATASPEFMAVEKNLIEPRQCRAARALLGWTQPELATKADTGLATVRDFERGARETEPETLAKLRMALERAGLEFIEAGKASSRSGGAGVRLKR